MRAWIIYLQRRQLCFIIMYIHQIRTSLENCWQYFIEVFTDQEYIFKLNFIFKFNQILIYKQRAWITISWLICGNNLNWFLNFNLIYKTLDWDKKWLFDFSAGKTQLVLFDWSNTCSIDVRENGWVCSWGKIIS